MGAAVDMFKAQRAVDIWRRDPVRFCREVLRFDPWESTNGTDSQADVLRAIPTNKTIAVRSGHKTGKSKLCAGAALWFYTLFDQSRVVLGAPTFRQIEEVVWREIELMWRNLLRDGIHLGGQIYEGPAGGVRHPSGREIFGFATNDKDNFSGISGKNVMYILDEGPGVEREIWDALEGNRAGGAWLITPGNPTQTDGQFYDFFHSDADCKTFHISSEHTPNALTGQSLIPGLATREWVEGRRRAWAPFETDNRYRVRVRGDFPTSGENNIVALSDITEAQRRWTAQPSASDEAKRLCVGLDCARFGDDQSALAFVRGHHVYTPVSRSGMDSIELAGWAHKMVVDMMTHAERSRVRGTMRPLVKVDEIGIGAGVYDQLRQYNDIEVVGVNVASSPTNRDEEKYANLRSQVWFGVAQFLKRGGTLPNIPQLRADLLAPRYDFNTQGEQRVESKDQLKKRLGRSPDLGDALCLALYEPPVFKPKLFNIPNL